MYIGHHRASRIEEVDGFERLGSETSPFTLRGGDEKTERAEEIHRTRPPDEQREDESSNEPLELAVDVWEKRLRTLDFPRTDTVPHEELLERAESMADVAKDNLFLDSIERDADIDERGKLGVFKPATAEIELDALSGGFLACRTGPVLAHEVGHAFHVGISKANQRAGFDSGTDAVFETEEQRRQAIEISERMRGTISRESEEARDYRLEDEELFADVFASYVIEPNAARRTGPKAVARVESYVSEYVPDRA